MRPVTLPLAIECFTAQWMLQTIPRMKNRATLRISLKADILYGTRDGVRLQRTQRGNDETSLEVRHSAGNFR